MTEPAKCFKITSPNKKDTVTALDNSQLVIFRKIDNSESAGIVVPMLIEAWNSGKPVYSEAGKFLVNMVVTARETLIKIRNTDTGYELLCSFFSDEFAEVLEFSNSAKEDKKNVLNY